jgi:segregation and condensation protein A
MSQVLVEVDHERYCDFSVMFDPEEGRMGVTVTFLAVLELVKEALIDIVQAVPFGPILVRAAQAKAYHNRLTEDSQEQSTN